MAKIILLNPPLSLGDLYGDLSESGSELPPLGIATLASVLREEGYNVSIIDAMPMRFSVKQTAEKILSEFPDYLGITSTTIAIFNAAEVARFVKQKNPDIKILLGGAHLTSVPEETMMKFRDIDVAVIGEGEETLKEFLYVDIHKGNLKNVRGIIFRDNGRIIRTQPRPFIENLDILPFPAWDLLPSLTQYYQPAADTLYRSPASSLVTSRGCPGQCIFCDRSVFGNKTRGFSANYVVKMIKILRNEYGIKDLFIHDDNFLALKKRLIDICNILIKEKIDITWSSEGRADLVTPEILKLMKEAGCWQINYGLESGSNYILKLLKKNVTVKMNENAVMWTKKAGIRVKGLFMLGNFGETKETFRETLDFIKRMPLDDFHMTCFTPFPGAEAFKEANKYGEFDPDWKKMAMFNAKNFIPYGFTRKEIEDRYRLAYRSFYLRPRIIIYYFRKLRNMRMALKIAKGLFSFLKFIFTNKVVYQDKG